MRLKSDKLDLLGGSSALPRMREGLSGSAAFIAYGEAEVSRSPHRPNRNGIYLQKLSEQAWVFSHVVCRFKHMPGLKSPARRQHRRLFWRRLRLDITPFVVPRTITVPGLNQIRNRRCRNLRAGGLVKRICRLLDMPSKKGRAPAFAENAMTVYRPERRPALRFVPTPFVL